MHKPSHWAESCEWPSLTTDYKKTHLILRLEIARYWCFLFSLHLEPAESVVRRVLACAADGQIQGSLSRKCTQHGPNMGGYHWPIAHRSSFCKGTARRHEGRTMGDNGWASPQEQNREVIKDKRTQKIGPGCWIPCGARTSLFLTLTQVLSAPCSSALLSLHRGVYLSSHWLFLWVSHSVIQGGVCLHIDNVRNHPFRWSICLSQMQHNVSPDFRFFPIRPTPSALFCWACNRDLV